MRTAFTLSIALCLLVAAGAFAQNNRSFVATFGNDANNCTPGNECRSFIRAMSVTNAGGEIVAVNSGGFGPFSIPKSIIVVAAPGVHAAITATSSNGIDVNATSSDRVVLRGLQITVTGSNNGIVGNLYNALVIENCSVTGGVDGIVIFGTSTSHALVVDTVAREASSYAFEIDSRAALIRCRGERAGAGMYVHDNGGTLDGTVSTTDFVAVANVTGILVTCFTAGHTVSLNVDHALVANNTQDGIHADNTLGAVNVRVNNSQVTENGGHGFAQSNSAYFGTMYNNLVEGNLGGDTAGTISLILVH